MKPSASAHVRREHLTLLAAAALYGLFIAALLPGFPIAMNDDFGYLRSIVETIQHGRLWTDDFLEPWTLSLTALAAGVFKLTGSFACATVGLQILLAAVAFLLAAELSRAAGSSLPGSIGIALALLTFPTVLWKQAEFTAMVLYLPCLLGALWAARQQRWLLFFLAWAVAVASRQSAAAWLALPVLAGLGKAWRERRLVPLGPPALVVALGLGWFFLVRGLANETHAQRFVTYPGLQQMTFARFWANARIVFWIGAVAAGCAAVLFRLRRPAAGSTSVTASARGGGIALALLLLATLPLVGSGIELSFEHPLFDNGWAVGYLQGLVLLAALGWAWLTPAFDLPCVGAALAALGITCLRGQLWDYYLVDVAIIMFFAVKPTGTVAATTVNRSLLKPLVAGAALAALIVAQGIATEPLKRRLDSCATGNILLEKALRAGWIKPTELSFASFGFVGWYLLPYYFDHEGVISDDLGGFNNYVAPDSIDLPIRTLSKREMAAAQANPDPTAPFTAIHALGWFNHGQWTLIKQDKPKPAQALIRWEEYQVPIFPLTDAEWREYIHGRR